MIKKRISDIFSNNLDYHRSDVPLIAMITRLTKQKGLELVRCVFQEIISEDIQMIVLGTGDREFEEFFVKWRAIYGEKFKVHIGFNEDLAHQLYAGADLFLMPSKFEPCGLGQLIAIKYGAVPIVRETGGLNDTVQSYNEFTGEGNGFTFKTLMPMTCCTPLEERLIFTSDQEIWDQLITQQWR